MKKYGFFGILRKEEALEESSAKVADGYGAHYLYAKHRGKECSLCPATSFPLN
jgi:hypothetical protein